MAKKKLSHDQKRKAKLKRRAERARRRESSTHGDQIYMDDQIHMVEKHIPIQLTTELGVLRAHAALDRGLTDDDVEGAYRRLVSQLRGGSPPYPTEEEATSNIPGEKSNLIIASIRRNWLDLLDRGRDPTRDDLIEVLQMLADSIDVWRDSVRGSRGYLEFLEGFMTEIGVLVDEEEDLEPDHSTEPLEDPKAVDSNPEAD